jgi:tetratricopeptide (TPR) repeat protein
MSIARAAYATALVAILASNGSAFPGEGRYLASKALDAYHKGDYEKAEELYSRAVEKAPNLPAIRFGLGNAHQKNGKFPDAMDAYKSVFDANSPGLNAAAGYNQGVIDHNAARTIVGSPDSQQLPPQASQEDATAKAIEQLKAALANYRSAMLQAPEDVDMKFNYELARRDLEELERRQQQQQQQQNDKKDQNNQAQKDDQQDKQDQQHQNQQDQGEKNEQNQEDKEQKGQNPEQEKPRETPSPGNNKDKQNDTPPEKQDGKANQEPKVGEMTPEDVQRLLNSLPDEDRKALMRFYDAEKMTPRQEMERDW